MTVLYHKRRTVHSIFQIRIFRNTKCAHKTGFPRPGQIYRPTETPGKGAHGLHLFIDKI